MVHHSSCVSNSRLQAPSPNIHVNAGCPCSQVGALATEGNLCAAKLRRSQIIKLLQGLIEHLMHVEVFFLGLCQFLCCKIKKQLNKAHIISKIHSQGMHTVLSQQGQAIYSYAENSSPESRKIKITYLQSNIRYLLFSCYTRDYMSWFQGIRTKGYARILQNVIFFTSKDDKLGRCKDIQYLSTKISMAQCHLVGRAHLKILA